MPMRRFFSCLSVSWLLVLALFAFAPPPGQAGPRAIVEQAPYFPGQLLVASPGISDPRFKKSVLYMVRHDKKGAVGIIVNRRVGKGPLSDLMTGFRLDSEGAKGAINVHFGGPVAPRRAFILHTSDYTHARSRSVDGSVSFTTDVKILRVMADGKGPRRVLFALGYAGWSAGQLEDEIERGDWSIAKATEGLVFGDGQGDAWERVVEGSTVPL
jgi:putative transcriptional regulator